MYRAGPIGPAKKSTLLAILLLYPKAGLSSHYVGESWKNWLYGLGLQTRYMLDELK